MFPKSRSRAGKPGGEGRRAEWGRGGAAAREGERWRDSFLPRSPGGYFLIIYRKVILAIQVRKKETRPP